jgi:hypothetical protein
VLTVELPFDGSAQNGVTHTRDSHPVS